MWAGRAYGGFRIWADKGVQKIEDLYMNGNLLTFEQLSNAISLEDTFKYLQLKHFILSKYKHIISEPSEPPLSHLEELALLNLKGRSQVSLLYDTLMSYDKEASFDRLEAWRLDVQEDIQESHRETACLNTQNQSINTRMRLLQYKWLMRTEPLVP